VKLADLKDLEKAIKLCRKLGVDVLKVDTVEFHLGQMPTTIQPTAKRAIKLDQVNPGMQAPGGITEDLIIPTTPGFEATGLTDEQMLFYSSQGFTGENN
jgi:hypothetical protein